MVTGDFNIKSKNWYTNDKTTEGGSKIELVTSQYRHHQIINEPTHVLENFSCCINLIFNLVVGSGVHLSSYPNYDHKIVYELYIPYEREIWHYGQVNTELIRRTIYEFHWQIAFSNLNVNERVSFFNITVWNFILHETIVCDDRDPLWINTRIKT